MYEAITNGIRVRVQPDYSTQQSAPVENRFFWTYTVEIRNEGELAVQLRTRHWRITDQRGRLEEVRGNGVVGKTPLLRPGESFSYTSGCPLTTPSGIMSGSYQMIDEQGASFDVTIPAFSLDSPFASRTVN